MSAQETGVRSVIAPVSVNRRGFTGTRIRRFSWAALNSRDSPVSPLAPPTQSLISPRGLVWVLVRVFGVLGSPLLLL